ncbi:MAG: hypothetical protein CMO34_05745 [Verrucomicrobia bacterium]|nr:hypothetical protein [Verrucomicrobiota bacterium]
MKKLNQNITAILLIVGMLACTVVENEEEVTPNTGSDTENKSGIGNSPVLLADSLDLVSKIAGDNIKVWTSNRFTLSGSTLFTSCRLDDIMTFNRDGSYRYDGGSQLCGAEDNRRIRTGRWTSDFDNKRIIFDKGSSREYTADIIGFSDTELRLRGSYMSMEVRGEYQAQ